LVRGRSRVEAFAPSHRPGATRRAPQAERARRVGGWSVDDTARDQWRRCT
jgi:hypothetical protein